MIENFQVVSYRLEVPFPRVMPLPMPVNMPSKAVMIELNPNAIASGEN
jgi:hypothetical protein